MKVYTGLDFKVIVTPLCTLRNEKFNFPSQPSSTVKDCKKTNIINVDIFKFISNCYSKICVSEVN